MSIIQRSKFDVELRDIDKDQKNKFRWNWLDKSVTLSLKNGKTDVLLSECIRKITEPGKALCIFCNHKIDYGTRGWKNIETHMLSKKHLKEVESRLTNYALSSSFFNNASTNDIVPNTVYGLNPALKVDQGKICSVEPPTKPSVPVSDRVLAGQAMVLGTLAEHSLPFTLSPVLINLAKELARDPKALAGLSMDRTSASMKMKYGLAETLLSQTINKIQNTKFSLNIDEATSSNLIRVLTVLVSYYCEDQERVIIEHLTSLSLESVDSQTIFNAIDSFFNQHKIPYDNLISILMDSCAVMRGSKRGFETRMRNERANHLLDVDGDSCHHIHNATKKFCQAFQFFVEGLFIDLHCDFKWLPVLRNKLNNICSILGVKFSVPSRYVSHRWLSCYDVAVETLRMWSAFSIYYYSYLSSEDSTTYNAIIINVCKAHNIKLNDEKFVALKKIQRFLSEKKPTTKEGKDRKTRIIKKLFYERKKTLLILQSYTAVLPLFKKYVCLFETKEPMIHKLYDQQLSLFKQFLCFFIKPEIIKKCKNTSELEALDLKKHLLKSKDMFMGLQATATLKRCNSTITKDFLENLESAFINCGAYLKKKLPLSNPVLICASALDPSQKGRAVTIRRLEQLRELIPNVLSKEEAEAYLLELRCYQVNDYLPSSNDTIRIDEWWTRVFKTDKYPSLSKMVKSVLSIFHGPIVEGTFSTMGDIIDKKSGKMDIKTYNAIQTVKCSLKSKGKTSIEYFHREDILHDPINRNLCQNMKVASAKYRRLNSNKKESVSTEVEFHASPGQQPLIKEACASLNNTVSLSNERKRKRSAEGDKNDSSGQAPGPSNRQKEQWKMFFAKSSKN